MRHAHAVAESTELADPARHLSREGRAAARLGGGWLAALAERPRLVITSPLTRAVQTAELVAFELEREGDAVDVEALPALAPGGDATLVAERLRRRAEAALVVGHEPGISGVAATLVGANEFPLIAPAQIVVIAGGEVSWSPSWSS
jgi:phosphohistidine phosphatase